jgi:hypothetical protein
LFLIATKYSLHNEAKMVELVENGAVMVAANFVYLMQLQQFSEDRRKVGTLLAFLVGATTS